MAGENLPEPLSCLHCGEPCPSTAAASLPGPFCCLGCSTVYQLLGDSGLTDFYRLSDRPGVRVPSSGLKDRWAFLDAPEVLDRLLEYRDSRTARVTFQLPTIHCVACIWLLENLFRLNPGIGATRVHFGRREALISYDPRSVRLSEVAGLLASLGYEPALTLAELDRPAAAPLSKLGLRIAVAGFAFGNIMLFSLPQYFGLDAFSGPSFRALFGGLSLLIALPALVFSAGDYWRSALASLRQRTLTLDVPIVAGLVAIYGQSAWQVLAGTGEGYFDSLCGLIFFLLCGRAFQQQTQDRLGFDRDYKGFFPLSVVRKNGPSEETVAISLLQVGDRLILRHGELVPADARLRSGTALIDYSFVTGESVPVACPEGERVYAGGRQVGGAIEVETLKPVSQSYLTSLWDDEAFRKNRDDHLATLTNRFSRRFTPVVLALAILAACGWTLAGDPARGLNAFISILIVACPCALALAAPFALGTAQRLLSRGGIFLRNAQVLEAVARVDSVVFDKTGTLTSPEASGAAFEGAAIRPEEAGGIAGVCSQSTHPHSRRITRSLAGSEPRPPVADFHEEAGQGVSGVVAGHRYRVGSRAWLAAAGIGFASAREATPDTSEVLVAIDGRYRGRFLLAQSLRPEVDRLLSEMGPRYEMTLLSGDHAQERAPFRRLFGETATLHFDQSPKDKLTFVRRLQGRGRTVMMVGDGLNDAGALRQSDVGVAVVEGIGRFSPASDIIVEASAVPWLGRVADFSKRTTAVVRAGFAISAAYNAGGIAIAAGGLLSPVVCAVLMPLSSITVVLVTVGATRWAARQTGLPADLRPPSRAVL